jgi:hypothetical protein
VTRYFSENLWSRSGMPDRESRPKYEKAKYEYPIHGINWTGGIGQPAGIFWLEGKSVIAAYGSAAEDYLLDRGAILVGTLRFDACPLERSHAGRTVDRVSPFVLV